MKSTLAGIYIISLVTLMIELVLTRVFDVILNLNLGHMVITCAMFSFGLSGIYATLRPLPVGRNVRNYLSKLSFFVALSTLAILPTTNFFAFDYTTIKSMNLILIVSLIGIYITLIIPFFFSGLMITTFFSAYSSEIQSLYFWDLTGAALGCVIFFPFIPLIGPGGLLFCAAGLAFFVSGILSTHRNWSMTAAVLGCLVILIPVFHFPNYYDFREVIPKRDVKRTKEQTKYKLEFTRWDTISKIDVIDQNNKKHIAYDGGAQSSHIFPFDGDFQELRENLPDIIDKHFWFRGVLASHYLKKDTNSKVLIIGSAGGQEIKAALTYGASRVDGIELVETVINLGQKKYSEYNGGIFNHPKVHVRVGEGRSILRASQDKYDIIQIFSNHTSSSIAVGNGAIATNYLQTSEAYQEYFEHLTDNGVLHINHHIYPRMVTTAALAWKQMGRNDFQNHVVVFEQINKYDNLPTFLVKKKPWTEVELKELKKLFLIMPSKRGNVYKLVEDPLQHDNSFLSPAFYSGALSRALVEKIDYRVEPSTDDRPYFNFLRKRIGVVNSNRETFLNKYIVMILNSQIRRGTLPMDIIHIFITGSFSIILSVLFIIVPLYFSNIGKSQWSRKYSTMLYFSCLGIGFIFIEIVFIQMFMKFIGFPIYTYSTVVFTLLFAAGIGSFFSKKLKITIRERWIWPFIGILGIGGLFFVFHHNIFNLFLGSPQVVRIIVAATIIFPLGFFLGMPFPLGILAIEKQPRGAIAWSWGLNALFTVVGGLCSIIFSIFLGFKLTLLIAFAFYTIAFFMFSRIRQFA